MLSFHSQRKFHFALVFVGILWSIQVADLTVVFLNGELPQSGVSLRIEEGIGIPITFLTIL